MSILVRAAAIIVAADAILQVARYHQECTMHTRNRLYHHALMLVVVLAVAGCDAYPDAARAETFGDRASVSTPAYQAGCERDNYPCTWAEVPDSSRARTYRVGQLVADFLAAADSVQQVVPMLDRIEGITDVAASELGIRFRLVGSRAIWVALPNASAAPRSSTPLSLGEEFADNRRTLACA